MIIRRELSANSMSVNTNMNVVHTYIQKAIEERIKNEVECAIEDAHKKMVEKIPEIVAGVVLNIMSTKEMAQVSDRFLFDVRVVK